MGEGRLNYNCISYNTNRVEHGVFRINHGMHVLSLHRVSIHYKCGICQREKMIILGPDVEIRCPYLSGGVSKVFLDRISPKY